MSTSAADAIARAVQRVRWFFTGRQPVLTESAPAGPILCAKCGSTSDMLRCRSCGEQFELTLSDRSWYQQRDMHPPQRCRACRRKRRKADLPKGTGVPVPQP